MIHVLRELAFWKVERKFRNQQAHEMMDDFIKEIVKRNNLSKFQALMIAPNEMENVLLNNAANANELNQRLKESVIVFKGLEYKILSGKDAENILKEKVLIKNLYKTCK